jgi:hypothetical protein
MAILQRRGRTTGAAAAASTRGDAAAATTARRSGISCARRCSVSCLIVVNAVWVTMVEVRYYMLDGSSLPLFITPIFLLLVLVLANLALRRLLPRIALRQEEMLTAYLMAVVSNTFAGHDMLQNFFGSVTHPYHFARPENNWQDLFLRSLPPSLFVTDPQALDAWYRGNVGADRAAGYLVHWTVPLVLWGVFFLVLVFLFGCITVLVRRAWTENERLAFPIIQLPLALTEPSAALLRSGRMWMGFSVAFLIGSVNGIHELYPSVPNAPWIKLYDVGQFFTVQPLEAIRTYGMQTSLYPFAIGPGLLHPAGPGLLVLVLVPVRRGYFVTGRAAGWDGPSAAQGWPFPARDLVGGVDRAGRRPALGEPALPGAGVRHGVRARPGGDKALRAETRSRRGATGGLFLGIFGSTLFPARAGATSWASRRSSRWRSSASCSPCPWRSRACGRSSGRRTRSCSSSRRRSGDAAGHQHPGGART